MAGWRAARAFAFEVVVGCGRGRCGFGLFLFCGSSLYELSVGLRANESFLSEFISPSVVLPLLPMYRGVQDVIE